MLNLVSVLAGWPDSWTPLLATVVFGVILVIAVGTTWRHVRRGWFIRLDHDGVTVRGKPPVPWTDLSHVRVSGTRPRWYINLLMPFISSVSFVPRPDVELPTVLMPGQPRTRIATWMNQKMFDSPLRFSPATTATTGQEVVDAVRALSDVPVEDQRDRGAP